VIKGFTLEKKRSINRAKKKGKAFLPSLLDFKEAGFD